MKRKFALNPEAWIKFTINVSLVIILFILAVFIGTVIRNDQLIRNEILSRARSYFNQIVVTRRWNAGFGGVFVEKKPGVISNKYMDNPDIKGCDGKVYTLKNPALMTREISEIAQTEGMFTFHITSLKPLNPENAADDFERDALGKFESGEKEVYKIVKMNENSFFRYMAPLRVEESCMPCHVKQGYKVGDIRGGISVNFNINDIRTAMVQSRIILLIIGIITALAPVGIVYFMITRLMNKLSEAYRKIELLATMDELTGLYNRRFIIEKLQSEFERSRRYGTPLSCIMIDIDYFKPINDTFGHQAGDAVLQNIAEWMKLNSRKSDFIGRYGGEEFLMVIPDEKNSAISVADKIRLYIEGRKIEFSNGKSVSVTVSIGIASSVIKDSGMESIEVLLKKSDDALYKAKKEGRNRIIIAD